MTVCSTTALRKYLTQHSNLGQPSREKAVSTTRAHAEGETIINSGRYRRPLFKSSQKGLDVQKPRVRTLTFCREFLHHGSPVRLLARFHLGSGLVASA